MMMKEGTVTIDVQKDNLYKDDFFTTIVLEDDTKLTLNSTELKDLFVMLNRVLERRGN